MATVTWEVPGSWTDAFAAANFNALANNGGILSTATAVDNTSGYDLYADLSFRMVTSTMTPTAGAHLAFYLLPLLDDGSTYPDNENTTTAANLPAITYMVAAMALRTKATQTQNGMVRGIIIPPGTFKWYVINRSGAALPSSATNMTCKYRLYSETVA